MFLTKRQDTLCRIVKRFLANRDISMTVSDYPGKRWRRAPTALVCRDGGPEGRSSPPADHNPGEQNDPKDSRRDPTLSTSK